MKDHVVFIVKRDNTFLFIKRAGAKKIMPNIWAFPSGTVEEGESFEDTTVREAKEELGLDVKVIKSLGNLDLPEHSAKLHLMVCSPVEKSEEIVFDMSEIQSVKWLTFQEFFERYNDDQIGKALVYLRKHPETWSRI